MRETPETILAWSDACFGSPTTLQIAVRTSKEVNEAMCAILNNAAPEVITDELADCGVMLWQVAARFGVDHYSTLGPLPVATDASRWAEAVYLQLAFTKVLDNLRLAAAYGRAHEPYYLTQAGVSLGNVIRSLTRLERAFAIDLQAAVDAKMAINRARTWAKGDDGSYQHVEANGNDTLAHPA